MQIGCALIGSLGALYNGVLLINLGIALFALVAIESSSQKLGRTYAVLLFCSLLLDVSWFILFTHEIWSLLFLTHFSFSTALQFSFLFMYILFTLVILYAFQFLCNFKFGFFKKKGKEKVIISSTKYE